MLFVDVNVLVYAHRSDLAQHADYLEWLDEARRGTEPVVLADAVASGFVRVVTHPGIFVEPTQLDVAFEFIDGLRASPAVADIAPGPRHWALFRELAHGADARGNLVPDAFLAAMAMEAGATLVSADRGFARFPALRWRHPLN